MYLNIGQGNGFLSTKYWSSTQYSSPQSPGQRAYYQYLGSFGGGGSGHEEKDEWNRVRAIRAF